MSAQQSSPQPNKTIKLKINWLPTVFLLLAAVFLLNKNFITGQILLSIDFNRCLSNKNYSVLVEENFWIKKQVICLNEQQTKTYAGTLDLPIASDRIYKVASE